MRTPALMQRVKYLSVHANVRGGLRPIDKKM